jgi:hypothetical protein
MRLPKASGWQIIRPLVPGKTQVLKLVELLASSAIPSKQTIANRAANADRIDFRHGHDVRLVSTIS